jgi:putative ABC transport system permease protein
MVDRTDQLDALLDRADTLLDPYGVYAKMKQEDKMSARFLADEIRGLGVTAQIVPTIFLVDRGADPARLAQPHGADGAHPDRPDEGLRLQQRRRRVHYIEYALVLGFMGCVMGYIVGTVIGGWIIGIYINIYQFPLLEQRDYPDILVRAFGLTVIFATLGAVMAAWNAANIDPAESMRAEAPKTARARSSNASPRSGNGSHSPGR